MGEKGRVTKAFWPKYNSAFISDEVIEIMIQINGKLRGKITISALDLEDKNKVLAQASSADKVRELLHAKKVINKIYVEGKLVNFVLAV